VTNLSNTDPLAQLDPDWQSVREGTPVIANDGTTIGHVEAKRTDGLYVRGDGQGAEDYLVTPSDIASIGADGVRLIVNSKQTMRAQADPDAPGGMLTDRPEQGQAPPS
jgi:hypothetical protein